MVFTIREAADIIGITRPTLRIWIKDGTIQAHSEIDPKRNCYRLVIKEEDLRKFMKTAKPFIREQIHYLDLAVREKIKKEEEETRNASEKFDIKPLYSTREVAERLHVSIDTVRHWVRKGVLRAIKSGPKLSDRNYITLPDALLFCVENPAYSRFQENVMGELYLYKTKQVLDFFGISNHKLSLLIDNCEYGLRIHGFDSTLRTRVFSNKDIFLFIQKNPKYFEAVERMLTYEV